MNRNLAILASLVLLAAPVCAQDSAATPPPPPPPTETTTSLLDLYKQGGWTMHLLLLSSIGTVGVAVYCFTQVTQSKMVPKPLVDTLTGSMQTRDVGGGVSDVSGAAE